MRDILKIIKYSWDLKRYYLWTGFFVVVVSLLNQTTPFFLKFIVDGLVKTSQGKTQPLSYFVIILALIFVVSIIVTLISNVQGYLGDRLGAGRLWGL